MKQYSGSQKKVRRFCNVCLTWMGLEDFALKEATQRRINSARFYLGEELKLVSLTGGRAASRGHRGARAAAPQRLTHFYLYCAQGTHINSGALYTQHLLELMLKVPITCNKN